MRVATTCAEVDRICDYIPLVSTISNIVDLFLKCVCKCLPEAIANNRYWTHIQEKDLSRCLALLVPILGNIYVLISDYREYKVDKILCDEAIEHHREAERSNAESLATFASLASGRQVTAEQMMPAPTEEQQRLWIACYGDDASTVRELLDKRISPNFSHVGIPPLIAACQYSTAEVVGLLIKAGAEVNTVDAYGNAPFAAACTKGDLEMVQLLRPYIQDIDSPGPRGITPLMLATTQGHRDVIAFLVEEGADLRKGANGEDAVTVAMFPQEHADLLPLLFEEGEEVDARRYAFQIPGDGLFSLFAPPTIRNLTPFLYASLVGAENCALYLLERSNVQHLDSTNSNALHYASEHLRLFKALLEKCHTPEFVNQQNIARSTPLHCSIRMDQPDAALLLLQNNANPFLPNKEGKTALILACEKGLESVIAYIREHFASQITPEMEEQIEAATQRRAEQLSQEPSEDRPNLLTSGLNLLQTGLRGLQSLAETRERRAQEREDRGPEPRTGMELFLGRHPWPVQF